MENFSKRNDVQSTKNTSTNFSRRRIIKNAFVLSFVFFLTFLAYDCLSMLQSTLNHENGIGVICQATVYGCFCISSLLLPKYVIKKLGCKVTLVLSMCLYLPYIMSNLYPHWSFMIPAAVLNGFAASLLWVAQSQYLNGIAVLYATETEKQATCKIKIPHVTKKNLKGRCSENQSMYCSDNCYSNKNPLKCDCDQYSGAKIVEKKLNEAPTSIFHISICEAQREAVDTNCISQDDYLSCKSCDLFTDVIGSNDAANKFESNSISSKSSVFSNKLNRKSNSDVTSNKDVQSISARFFGIHGMAYLSCHMLSNLMSYFILQNDALHSNVSLNSSCTCGAQFCNEQTECFVHNLQEPSRENRNLLIGLCVGLGFISIFILAIFLDPLNDRNQKVTFSLELLMATAKHSKKTKCILLTPFFFYIGMMQGFYTGDFNMSFVGCAWGTFHVGLVSVCYGAACSLSSPLAGYLVKRIGRIPVIAFGALVTLPAQILLLFWQPNAETPALFFLIAGLWGTSVGVLWSQVKAMCGSLFKKEHEEAAFSAYHLWYSLGFCVSFAYSNHLCIYIKVYILMAVLTLGTIGYFSIEIILRDK